jgi:L-aminopeptidase/D-esterase-like protein
VLPDGSSVAALVVCNAAGSPVDPRSGDLLGARIMLEEDFPGLSTPTRSERESLMSVVDAHRPSRGAPMTTHTSIGVVATNATLTKAQCSKMAATAHDGLARALNPVHTQFDGDTLFSVSTATGPVPDELAFHHILCAASDVVTRALVRGLLAASTVQTSAGRWPAYLDLAPSAGAR